MRENRIARWSPEKGEIDDLRVAVHRNLRDAGISDLSDDNRFGLAYEAALLLGKMVVACAGFRTKGMGAHQTTFLGIEIAMGPAQKNRAAYFDRCRRKRNTVSYDCARAASRSEALELIAELRAFQSAVESWIAKRHPSLGR